MTEVAAAHGALEAVFVIARIGDSHKIPVVDFMAASFTNLVVFLAFDAIFY